MTQFLGTFTGKLDAKSRVSIPAPFRAELRQAADAGGLILRPSHKYACLEGWTRAAFDELAGPMQRLDIFSDDGDDLAYALYADATPAEPDKEGRIVLAAELVRHAGLADAVVFVGLRRKFEIWEPAAYAARRAEALARAREGRLTLPGAVS